MSATENDDEAIEVSADHRRRAHEAIDRWFDECLSQGTRAWMVGRSGYVGRIKLRAFVDDEGVSLSIERSITEDL